MGSPGYKHIVRLRVQATGSVSHVDAFVIGVVDPVTRRDPVLVDTFRFDPVVSQTAPAADSPPEPKAPPDGA